MKKILIIGTLSLLALTGLAAAWFWYQMGEPLYQPGELRTGIVPLDPPGKPTNGDTWLVEEGIELHHFADGNGRNVLVVHGGPGYPFESPIAALAPLSDRFRFVYYDQRGCGRSTRPVDSFSSSNFYANMMELDAALGLAAQIADIERIRRILGDEKLVIVGYSFGGFLATMYAAEFPERVEAMILVAPANVLVFPVTGGDLFAEVERRLPESLRAEYAEYLVEYLDFGGVFSKSESDLQSLNSRFAAYYLTAAGAIDTPDAGQKVFGEPGWMVQAMYLSMGRRHDYRAALRSIFAPVLVLHGSDDMQPEAAARGYVEALPNAEFDVIEGAGHMMFEDRPKAFAERVDGFLTRTRP